MWGLLPLLFQAVERTGALAFETVAWRTLFAVPFAALLVLWSGQGTALRALGVRGLATLALSASLIGVNWLIYVWAVTSGRTLEGSLGYYINPLLSMAAGRLLFNERIAWSGWVAVGFATVGVALQAVALGAVPSAYVAWTLAHGGGAFGHRADASWLLFLCGPATVAPLACFAVAARRLPLTLVGFLQFIAPTLQFGVGVYNGETLTPLRVLSFGFIWGGVLVFAAAALLRVRAARRPDRRAP